MAFEKNTFGAGFTKVKIRRPNFSSLRKVFRFPYVQGLEIHFRELGTHQDRE